MLWPVPPAIRREAPGRPAAEAPQPLHRRLRGLSNRVQADGRMNAGLDAAGRRISLSVPPDAMQFWENIEAGIRPVVAALRAKRYLTYSSCAGHGLQERRFVAVAFLDDESRERLLTPLSGAGLSLLRISRPERVANIALQPVGSQGLQARSVREEPQGPWEGEVEGFNALFGRRYGAYVFAEIEIGGWLPGPWWRNAWALTWKRLVWERETLALARLISGPAVPRYRF